MIEDDFSEADEDCADCGHPSRSEAHAETCGTATAWDLSTCICEARNRDECAGCHA